MAAAEQKQEVIIKYNDYVFTSDDLNGWTYVSSLESGLPMSLFVENGNCKRYEKHTVWAIIRNGYDSKDKGFIAFNCVGKPQMMNEPKKLQLRKMDVELVKKFIVDNRELLWSYAHSEINENDFFEKLNK